MKFKDYRPFATPDAAERKLLELANDDDRRSPAITKCYFDKMGTSRM
jgi:hypothetical protein